MADGEENLTEYDRLTREFARVAGPLETLMEPISSGIEMEAFAGTPAGKKLIGMAIMGARSSIEVILDPEVPNEKLMHAVFELRVRHRVLDFIKTTIDAGHAATQQVRHVDQLTTEENPDERDT